MPKSKKDPPSCLWARSGRVLMSFAASPEPQSSLLRGLQGAWSPNCQISRALARFPWALPRLPAS
eukprot:5600321-Pyramimonas_sp.AAC.1